MPVTVHSSTITKESSHSIRKLQQFLLRPYQLRVEFQFEGMDGEIRASRRKEITFTEPQLHASLPHQDALLVLNPQDFTDFFTYSGSRALVGSSGNVVIEQNLPALVFQLVFIQSQESNSVLYINLVTGHLLNWLIASNAFPVLFLEMFQVLNHIIYK